MTSYDEPSHFEARDLAPYPEPISPDDLELRFIYVCLNYLDDEMLIPIFDTIVFIGRDLNANDAGVLYFQDICSYENGVRFGEEYEDDLAAFLVSYYVRSEDSLSDIFEYERAIEELMRCSLRRSQANGKGLRITGWEKDRVGGSTGS